MGIKSLQEFLESHCSGACVSVDLLKISRGFVPKRRGRYPGSGRFCLVVDAESCLDRLYGGFFSDWVCGGQWNRMNSFLGSLIQACQNANMELIFFFNGALESQKISDWYADEVTAKKKVNSVLRHVNNKGTPPPKIWWIPPVFLRGALRMALRNLGVAMACSMDDHAQEVIGYCREHNLQGIIAQDSVYAIFDPPRYFSSNNLKLTYKGSLETKEYIMDEIAKCLDLNPNRFCIFAALLGNHILPDEDLYDFFRDLLNKAQEDGKNSKATPENMINAVVDFVRSLPAVENLDVIGEAVFKTSKGNKQELLGKFRQSVQYYLNGTQDGFLKYKPRIMPGSPHQGHYPTPHPPVSIPQGGSYSDHSQSGAAPSIVIDPPNQAVVSAKLETALISEVQHVLDTHTQNMILKHGDYGYAGDVHHGHGHVKPEQLAASSSSSSSSDGLSPSRVSPEASTALKSQNKPKSADSSAKLPEISPEITRIASERHQKGMMSPWIYQILSQGEVKLTVCLEDESSRELPTVVELYRPIRQTVYSVLLNLNKLKIIHENQNKDKGDTPAKMFQYPVKEWFVRRGNNKPSHEVVIAKPVDWKTPSIERMWLGTNVDDKTRRLRAFLTCMKSDSPLMLNTQYVQQHLLLLCCVLRYILQFSRVLQRQELDAFLAMSVSPLLHDVQTMQDLKLPSVEPRGVQLAALFMAGAETAIFANDVCGAPIPWTMVCPWLYFDGKLFHFKLLKANNNTPLIDMCDGQVDQVLRVERMRQAIMEGLQVEFAKPMLPTAALYGHYPFPPYGHPGHPGQFGHPGDMGHPGHPFNYRPEGMRGLPPGARGRYPPPLMSLDTTPKGPGRGRGLLAYGFSSGHSPVDSRGGQLEIAGVVVGSWGPNLSAAGRGPMGPGPRSQGGMGPKVMSVGGQRRLMPRYYRGSPRGMPAFRPIRGRPTQMYGMGRGLRPDQRSYARGRGVVVHGVRRPQIRVRPRPTTSKKSSSSGGGRGRGVTVEAINENGISAVVSVNDALSGEEVDDKFANADDEIETGAISKYPNMVDGLQSPDSGIHSDKSGLEINIQS